MSSIFDTLVELTYEEVGGMMFLLENRIKGLRSSIDNTIYASDLIENMKRSLVIATSTYLKISKKEELDF